MALITSTDLQARLSSDVYLRVFDRNGTGTVDATFVATCIGEGISEVQMKLAAAFPDPTAYDNASADIKVKGAAVSCSLYAAVRYNPLGTGDSASTYRQAWKDAIDFLDSLRKDDGQRLYTASQTRALPIATVDNAQTDAGDFTNPFGRAADKRDPSGY